MRKTDWVRIALLYHAGRARPGRRRVSLKRCQRRRGRDNAARVVLGIDELLGEDPLPSRVFRALLAMSAGAAHSSAFIGGPGRNPLVTVTRRTVGIRVDAQQLKNRFGARQFHDSNFFQSYTSAPVPRIPPNLLRQSNLRLAKDRVLPCARSITEVNTYWIVINWGFSKTPMQ